MKIYTEEQVKKAIEMARSSYNSFSTPFIYGEHEVFEKLTPIELPSDEDFGDMSKAYIEHINTMVHADLERDGYLNVGFHQGAKWMRDKIQGGNKL
jgi:hypothetical protein